MSFEEKTIRQQTVYNGRIFNVVTHDVLLPNGKTSVRDIVQHAGAVGIIAIRGEQMVLVRQYRKALEKVTLEIPAGLRDKAGEPLLETAKRELVEETRLQAKEWQKIADMALSPGFSDEIITLYEAKGLQHASERLVPDADEHVAVVYYTRQQVQEAIESGEICDAKTLYAVQYWDMNRGKS